MEILLATTLKQVLTGDKLEIAFRVGAYTAVGDLFWYGILAGGVWLVFHVCFSRWLSRRRISKQRREPGQLRREIGHSVRSIAIFGLVSAGVVYAALCGWTKIYLNISQYGWGWFFLSIGVMIVLHDTYFYWTHRLMHHRRLFRLFHRTHHLSTDPSPWAAYAFSPLEALVQAGIGPLIVVTLPTHPAAFSLFMVWQISFNVFGHCGYEIYPSWFLESRLGWLLNSPTHHSLHHEKFRANYGLYFNVWDRLMRTNHSAYSKRFSQVTHFAHGS